MLIILTRFQTVGDNVSNKVGEWWLCNGDYWIDPTDGFLHLSESFLINYERLETSNGSFITNYLNRFLSFAAPSLTRVADIQTTKGITSQNTHE